MNSLVTLYRQRAKEKSVNKFDGVDDNELTLMLGREAESTNQTALFDKFPDFAVQYKALSNPAPVAPVAVAAPAAPKEAPSGMIRQTVGDAGSALGGGLAKLGESVDDLVGLTTGSDVRPVQAVADALGAGASAVVEAVSGRGDTGLEAAREVTTGDTAVDEQGSSFFERQKSGELKQAKAERRRSIDNAGEVFGSKELGKALTAVGETATSPRLLMDFVVEQLPMLLPGIGAARVASAAGLGIKAATLVSVGVGAVLQGADVGSDTLADVTTLLRDMPDDQARQVPEIAELIKEGATLDAARAAVALSAARKAGVIGALASAALNALPGGDAIEKSLARLASGSAMKSTVRGVVGAAASEALTEAAEETSGVVARNAQAQNIDPSRLLFADAGEAGGMGFMGGAAMGGGVRALEGGSHEDSTPPPAPAPASPAADARRRAADTARATPTPSAQPEATPASPRQRAAVIAQNPAAARGRLDVLEALESPTAEEIAERDALTELNLALNFDPVRANRAAPAAYKAPAAPIATPSTAGEPPTAPGAATPAGAPLVTETPPPPATASGLRQRIQTANRRALRVFNALPGIEADAVNTAIASLAKESSPESVAALESAVEELEQRSVTVAAERTAAQIAGQQERVKRANEKKAAKQEAKNKKAAAALAKVEATATEEAASESAALTERAQAELAATPPSAPQARLDFSDIEESGFINFAGVAEGLAAARKAGREITETEADEIARRFTDAMEARAKARREQKLGGFFADEGNASDTRTAIAWQVPDGRVLVTGLLVPKPTQALGMSGKKLNGLRVARMASGSRSKTGKMFTPGGGEPVLFSEMIRAGAAPVDIIQFTGNPGKPFQAFPSLESYTAAATSTPKVTRSVRSEGGDNAFQAGGARTTQTEEGAVNLDAAQLAEAEAARASNQTATQDTAVREQVAQAWRTDPEQAIALFGVIERNGGDAVAALAKLRTTRTRLGKELLGWFTETTSGLELPEVDLAVSRMYEDAAGDADKFAALGGEPASWIARRTDVRSAPAPVIKDGQGALPAPAASEVDAVAQAQAAAASAYDINPVNIAPETAGETLAFVESAIAAVAAAKTSAPKAKVDLGNGESVTWGVAAKKLESIAGKLRKQVEAAAPQIEDSVVPVSQAFSELDEELTADLYLEVTNAGGFTRSAYDVLAPDWQAWLAETAQQAGITIDQMIAIVDGAFQTATKALAPQSPKAFQRFIAALTKKKLTKFREEGVDGDGSILGNELPQRLPPFAREAARQDRRFAEAAEVAERARRVEEGLPRTSGSSKVPQRVRSAEQSALRAWANKNEALVDSAEFDRDWKEQGQQGGEEHQVVIRGNRVWKRGFADGSFGEMVLPYHASYSEYFERMAMHNALFPDAAYRFEGFIESPAGLSPVFSQPAIIGSPAPRAAVEAEMQKLGFRRTSDDNYKNNEGVIIEDLHDDNVVIDPSGALRFIDPVIYYKPTVKMRTETPATAAVQGERSREFNRVTSALRERGIRVDLVVRNIVENTRATGANYSPYHIAVAMENVANGNTRDLISLLHESGHSELGQLSDQFRHKVLAAAERAMSTLSARAVEAAGKTGANVASNIGTNPEETLVETLAQEIAAEGVPESRSLAERMVAWVKDLYIRTAMAFQSSFGREPSEKLALDWFENHMRRVVGGDFDWRFADVVTRWLPHTAQETVSGYENADGSTPGNTAVFADHLTGETTSPREVQWREEALNSDEAFAHIQAAAINENTPVLAELKKNVAPSMTDLEFWKIVGKGDLPAETLTALESRVRGSLNAKIGDEGETPAMRQRAVNRAYRLAKFTRDLNVRRGSKLEEQVKVASDRLVDQAQATNKIEAEFRNAAVQEEILKQRLAAQVTQLSRDLSRGPDAGFAAGRLYRSIQEAEGLVDGDAIPESYQRVFKKVMDGEVSVFDYLSAMSKLDLAFGDMTVPQIIEAVKNSAPKDARLQQLAANRPLLVALSSLARNNTREMNLLQLRQLRDTAEYLSIKKELDEIREASDTRLDELSATATANAKARGLRERLRFDYLKERRTLRALQRTIQRGEARRVIHEAAAAAFTEKVTRLEKEVGNFSTWTPTDGAKWRAMYQGANDVWKSTELELSFKDDGTTANPEAIRSALATNWEYLRNNPELAGTQLYEEVKRQTQELTMLDVQKQYQATHSFFLDKLFQDLGSKFASTGTNAGQRVKQMLIRWDFINKSHSATDVEPRARKWTAAVQDASKAAGFKDVREFMQQVYDPVIYKLESEPGLDEKAALREGVRAARRRLTGEPAADFDAKMATLLTRTKDVSEKMLDIAEQNGVYVGDPRLGGQLRKAMAQGWLTVPRRMRSAVVTVLTKDMAKAGWSLEMADRAAGGKRVVRSTTFDSVDAAQDAGGLSAQLAPYFTKDVTERFLEPFMRKPGAPVFRALDGRPISQLLTEQVWVESGGDVVTFMDKLAAETGALDQKKNPAASLGEWRRHILGKIEGLYVMEARLANDAGVVRSLYDPHGAKPHRLMDARTNDLLPPEHLEYDYFDPASARVALSEVAFHAAFGRNGAGLDASMGEIQNQLKVRKDVFDGLPAGSRARRAEAAKALGYDYRTLERSAHDFGKVQSWMGQIGEYFGTKNQAGAVGDARAALELVQFQSQLILNQPKSALWQLLSAVEFPITYRGVNKPAVAAMANAGVNFFKGAMGSALESVGLHIMRSSSYAKELGEVIEGRAGQRLPWGEATADIGRGGRFAETFADRNVIAPVRKVQSVLRKGVQVGGGESREFGRFNALSSPFQFVTQQMATAVATANVQVFEQMVKRGMDFFARNPEAANDPSYRLSAKDLDMEGGGFFGSEGAYDFFRNKAVEYRAGNLEDIVREAQVRARKGERLLSREQALSVGMMALNEVSLESSINTRPAEYFNNPILKFGLPLMGWPIAKMTQVNQLLKTSDGQLEWKAAVKGLGIMAAWALPVGVAFSLLMDEYDEKVLGKKSNLRSADSIMGWLERGARAGNVYGLGADFALGFLSPLDPASGQRDFTLDSRVLVWSQINTIRQALVNANNQDAATWASVYRQLMVGAGGNGLLQAQQILNENLGLDNAEARVTNRTNVNNWLRAAARDSQIEVRRGGGSSSPTPTSVWVREMQLAAYAGDRLGFLQNYRKAIAAAREGGDSDPENKILQSWKSRQPFLSVLGHKPTQSEEVKMFAAMSEEGRRSVREAVRLYDGFTELIEPTPFQKAQASARRASDPAARLEARRKAAGLAY